jgi:hypothetical protein
MLAAAGLAQSATAQSWRYGPPGLDGPPVVYYDPRFVAPPGHYAVPRGRRLLPVPTVVSPDAVFDRLEDAGYSGLSPMAPRGEFYKLTAIDPAGNLVRLEVSIFSGTIENSYVLEAGVRVPSAPVERNRKRVRAPAAPVAAEPARPIEPAALPRPRPNPEPAQANAAAPPAAAEPTEAAAPTPPAAAEPTEAAAPTPPAAAEPAEAAALTGPAATEPAEPTTEPAESAAEPARSATPPPPTAATSTRAEPAEPAASPAAAESAQAAAEPAEAAAPPPTATEPAEEETSTLKGRLFPPPEEEGEDEDPGPRVIY